MHSIPPNNLDQLIAWIRVFSEETKVQIQGLQKTLQEMREKEKS